MSVRCLLETSEAARCPSVGDEDFPLCDKHLAKLGRELRFKIAKHIRENFVEKGDEAFIFNRKNGEVYSLNSTATFILRSLMEEKDLRSLLEGICASFETDSLRDAIEGCRDFVAELRELGLGESEDG